MIDSVLIDDCRRLQEAIAPELSADPLYIVAADELRGLPFPSACLGWADDGSIVNYTLRGRLGERWQGPGRTICLDTAAIAQQSEPGHLHRCSLNVFTHELAHLVPASALDRNENKSSSITVVRDRICRERGLALPEPAFAEADEAHGPKFIRYAMHLFVRARAAGFDIPLRGLIGFYSGLCDANFLELVLGEAALMLGCSFAEIAATPMPAAIEAEYQATLDWWRKLRKNRPEVKAYDRDDDERAV